jgi:malonate transporter MadL subunit
MKIYGVAILAGCYLAGLLTGELLGRLTGVHGNIGGVGFAMLMLIVLSDWMKKKGYPGTEPEKGIMFWNAMYIPVVIAMSATQHVNLTLHSRWVAI